MREATVEFVFSKMKFFFVNFLLQEIIGGYEQSCKFDKLSMSWAELSLTDEKLQWAELDPIKIFLSWAGPDLKNPELSSKTQF